ncbi:Hypothetical protein CINCED_3A008428 [Cinara cedri]|uniref:Uncharacterized protein n=1 Tax=Cinara cedri TaxID=506608 RepID=A0A5E4MP40_9HEMI|nr:Hypothetical protein CINCED_3A008428 [Cinara cedri]
MEPKKIAACTLLWFFAYPGVYGTDEIDKTDDILDPVADAQSTATNADDKIGLNVEMTEKPLPISILENNYKEKIEAVSSDCLSKTLCPISGLVVPNELSSVVGSYDQLIGLLHSPKLLATLSTAQIHSIISVLTSSPGLLTVLPVSALVNVLSALCSSREILAALPKHRLYALLMVFTVRPNLLSSLPTALLVQLAAGLLSLSPGVLYDVPASVLEKFLGSACTPDVLGSLTVPQLVNLLTLLSLSVPLVKGLPVVAFVALVDFLGLKPTVLGVLPPTTLFALLRGLFETVSESSLYLLNGSTVAAVVKLFAVLLTPQILNVLPLKTFDTLLAIFWSSPSLLAALPTANVVSLLSAVASSPNILVAVNACYLQSLLVTIASDPILLKAVPRRLIVELINAMVTYLPKCVRSIPKPTLCTLLGTDV